jgi:glycosyltransferase involved in cell wall biosynthesis
LVISSKNKKNILFLVPSPLGISPGQRFRFEHYLPYLQEQGFSYTVKPFLSLNGRKQLYKPGNVLGKIGAMAGGFIRRLSLLFILHRFQYIYIYRWAATAGPPIIEWVIAKVYRKKIIYDFDDAIWVNESAYNKKFLAVKFLGNEFLFQFAKKNNPNTQIIPTVVNTDTVHSRLQNHKVEKPAVGWTGSFSTLLYLDMIIPLLQRLQEKINFTFYVIADKDPQLPLKNYQFIKWTEEKEVEDLLRFHIGLMPLTDDDITRGKCGFKAIQYMSLGIPAVVSPVGVNTKIVDTGIDGFVCATDNEWEDKIMLLLTDSELRTKMGVEAQKKIIQNYSVAATKEKFIQLFS